MPPPDFPQPFVIDRTRSLGFGTGPWTRQQFIDRWGAPMADKYIAEAKAAGWLISPSRGTYTVPAAQDLMVVSWLPEPSRTEFLVSRTLANAKLPYWCLSAWCRERGLDLGGPLFVTDLGASGTASTKPVDRKALRESFRRIAEQRQTLPFLDELLIVPKLPAFADQPKPRLAPVPEKPDTMNRRQTQRALMQAGVGLISLATWAITKEFPEEGMSEMQRLEQEDLAARAVPYSVGPDVKDEAWIAALLASVGTSRVEELVATKLRDRIRAKGDAVQAWAGLFGPPQPTSAWKDVLKGGPFPFLLVPPKLWSEMGADQAARRFRILERLGGE